MNREVAMHELRKAMQEVQPPSELQLKALELYRMQHSAANRRSNWLYAIAMAAAAIICIAVYLGTRPESKPGPIVAKAPEAPVTIASAVAPAPAPTSVTPPVPAAVAARRARPRKVQRGSEPRPESPVTEVATDFLPLPYAPPLARGEAATVIRVGLPQSAVRQFGLPVSYERNMQRVPADIVLGQDGVARAVRFVSYTR